MTVTWLQFLIVCPLVFLAGFVDAVVGGGGLISIPAYMISGIPVHLTLGTNKLSAGMGTALATYRYAKSGFIHWKLALLCAIFALVGSTTGAQLALLLDDYVFRILMLFIIPLTALYVFRGRALDGLKEKAPYSKGITYILSFSIALVIGVYDGFYGPGTGTFLILLLMGAVHMKLSEANGITKVINLTTDLSALVVFLLNGKVLLLLGLVAGCFSIAGNYIGTKFFVQKGGKAVRPLILAVMVIFFIKVLSELLA